MSLLLDKKWLRKRRRRSHQWDAQFLPGTHSLDSGHGI